MKNDKNNDGGHFVYPALLKWPEICGIIICLQLIISSNNFQCFFHLIPKLNMYSRTTDRLYVKTWGQLSKKTRLRLCVCMDVSETWRDSVPCTRKLPHLISAKSIQPFWHIPKVEKYWKFAITRLRVNIIFWKCDKIISFEVQTNT